MTPPHPKYFLGSDISARTLLPLHLSNQIQQIFGADVVMPVPLKTYIVYHPMLSFRTPEQGQGLEEVGDEFSSLKE